MVAPPDFHTCLRLFSNLSDSCGPESMSMRYLRLQYVGGDVRKGFCFRVYMSENFLFTLTRNLYGHPTRNEQHPMDLLSISNARVFELEYKLIMLGLPRRLQESARRTKNGQSKLAVFIFSDDLVQLCDRILGNCTLSGRLSAACSYLHCRLRREQVSDSLVHVFVLDLTSVLPFRSFRSPELSSTRIKRFLKPVHRRLFKP